MGGSIGENVDKGRDNNELRDRFGSRSCNDGRVLLLLTDPDDGVDAAEAEAGPRLGLDEDVERVRVGFRPTGVVGALPVNGNGIGPLMCDLRTERKGRSDCLRMRGLDGVIGSGETPSLSIAESGEPVEVDVEVRGGVLISDIGGSASLEITISC
jgi:hypothetical protein